MTVKELIEELKKVSPNAEIEVNLILHDMPRTLIPDGIGVFELTEKIVQLDLGKF